MFNLLSQYWLDSHHSDGILEVLATTPTTQQCQQVVARVPIHCVVVSSASTYFSTLLSPAWQQQEAQSNSRRRIQLVVGDSADIVAMLALLKCIYTGSLELTDADLSNTLQQPGSAAAGVCSGQVLVLRVIQLADQYGVQGVLSVAISKLTRLFSHQLEWSTIEAVLWMPASLSTDPCMAALRQLAVSGVKQRLGVLDDALAQPSGRQMLQCLPADVLAAILSSDTLATTSENTVLAAVDVWLAGPVAQTLDRQPDSPTDSAAQTSGPLQRHYHTAATQQQQQQPLLLPAAEGG